ncbi:hypothetical protein Agabi119p4_1857 [Agaricus bisporus var. burnettii]|uniref:PPM-type phosphatase domain-containing protein n=1 Tax=Agaricus bisporus var. burnettii TaxID=192524 RepID=A0A8H7F7X9_AGABI|nr:hypothetical protein Agabi119p4_1857 [Agaricus bisporus var. burnettii]
MTSSTQSTNLGWPDQESICKYTSYTEPLLSSELARRASATTLGDTHLVSFQPSPNPHLANQDRYVVQDWPLPDGLWSFRAIFDGHGGHATVDYATQVLPTQLKQHLEARSQSHPDYISQLLHDTIVHFDESLKRDLLAILPDVDVIAQMTNDKLHTLVGDLQASEDRDMVLKRCMHGTTALIALFDPPKRNLWVATLGDGIAALGKKDHLGKWSASLLSSFHNGCNDVEVEQIRKDHPGEAECVRNNRVLGAIAVTRALGDHCFKLSPIFSDQIFSRTYPGFSFSATSLEEIIARNLTPPYVSNRPDVQHVNLNNDQYQETRLIMCSDGLVDLYLDQSESLTQEQLPEIWLRALDKRDTSSNTGDNLALALLRHALGGEDAETVSRNMTLEYEEAKWMDDTTILVQGI